MDQAEDRLAQAARLVCEGEGHVTNHRALIRSLEEADRRTEASLARDELSTLEDTLELARIYLQLEHSARMYPEQRPAGLAWVGPGTGVIPGAWGLSLGGARGRGRKRGPDCPTRALEHPSAGPLPEPARLRR